MPEMGDEEPNEGEGEGDSRARLMQEVAEQMDAIEADFGDDFEIGSVITIVEIRQPEGSGVRVRSNAPLWVGLGMLELAGKVLEAQAGG